MVRNESLRTHEIIDPHSLDDRTRLIRLHNLQTAHKDGITPRQTAFIISELMDILREKPDTPLHVSQNGISKKTQTARINKGIEHIELRKTKGQNNEEKLTCQIDTILRQMSDDQQPMVLSEILSIPVDNNSTPVSITRNITPLHPLEMRRKNSYNEQDILRRQGLEKVDNLDNQSLRSYMNTVLKTFEDARASRE